MISLKRIFNIESQVEKKIFLLLALGFFIGVFNVTFLVHSSSTFLNLFDEKTDLPKAIILSGFLGVSMAWLFAFIQNRAAFFRLSIAVFLLILVVLAVLRLGFEYKNLRREFAFISFVFIGPLNAITMLIFWGLVGRMFSIKQTKKIIGSIDSGQLVGTIITSFSIPLVLRFMSESINLLLIGGTSIVIALGVLVVTREKYSSEVFENETETGKRKAVSYVELFRNKYIIVIAAFIAVSMVGAVFVDYSFLHVTAQNYPDPKDLAIFIARFEGTMLIFSFLVQSFVTDRLIALYGLKVTILVTPVVLLLCCVVAMIMGLSLEYGVMFNSFILFFLAISLCKLFNTALKDAIDGPTIKLYILPVDSSIRLDVQSKIDGVIKLFASLLGGLILIAIESSKLFPVTLISLFLFVVIAVWIIIANTMYRKYKETLENTLANTPVKEEESYKTEYAIGKLLQSELDNHDHRRVMSALNFIEQIQPFLLDDSLKLLTRTTDLQLHGIVNEKYGKSIAELNKAGSLQVGMRYDHDEIKKLSKSKNFTDRIKAANEIRNTSDIDDVYILNELLKDENKQVVKAAIKTAGILQNAESYSSLIELLGNAENSNAVIGTLIPFGDKIIPALEVAFQKVDQKENVMYKILYIYGQMGSALAIEKLWQKISYPDLEILTILLKALHHLKVKSTGDQVNIVNTLLENEIRKAAWNISAIEELDDDQHLALLRNALEEEIAQNYDIIYILLSLVYDHQSIQLVRDNIESGTNEGRVFAIELLDVFIAKETKQLLFPLLDDVPIHEKIKNLQLHFPREIFNEVEVLKQIINRDYNNIGRWTKSCALYSYALTSKAPICNDLIANFFNPNSLIRETAAWAVVKKDKAIFKHILTRILNLKRNKNDLLLNELIAFADSNNQPILRIDKIVFLKIIGYFSNITGAVLAEFAETSKEVRLAEGEGFKIMDDADNSPVFIVFRGKVAVFDGDKHLRTLGEKSFFDHVNGPFTADCIELVASVDSVLLKINRGDLYDFMIKHYQLTEGIIALSHSEGIELIAG